MISLLQTLFRQKMGESEKYFRTLIEISPYGIMITDTGGFPIFISQKAREVFRIPMDLELKQLWIFRFVSPEERDDLILRFNQSVKEKKKAGNLSTNAIHLMVEAFASKLFHLQSSMTLKKLPD